MPQSGTTGSRAKAWLMSQSGASAGTRFPMPDGTIRIGRAPDNDVVIDGPDCAMVSLNHVEISRDNDSWRVHDLNSTNGTWLNGERVTDAEVTPPAVLRMGSQGPEFALVLEEAAPEGLDRTIEIPADVIGPVAQGSRPLAGHEDLLSSAVARARRMRAHGVTGQTMTIMRGVVEQALQQTRRRMKIIGYSLLAGLLTVSTLAVWKISTMRSEKRAIDTHIQQLEAQLEKANAGVDVDGLISQLGDYQNEAESLEHSLLYRIGGGEQKANYVVRGLHSLMAEFGAEVYSIPPDFIERVNYYIEQDEGPNRPIMVRALDQSSGEIDTIRRILEEQHLPPDLAYLPLVESALTTGKTSAAGAAGPWQFTEPTAKAYGLLVSGRIDERKSLAKSTLAACKYLRDLILNFGTGSSVMLALAAYDSGAAKVKQAVDRNVRDPIKQRNFWYLYRRRALPLETREYVPKVFAAMLIGRDPRHFGFG
jgi:pSer/pThr/pTyr-binding forkhead associated (FHA) protein